jgi:hypothetical protein
MHYRGNFENVLQISAITFSEEMGGDIENWNEVREMRFSKRECFRMYRDVYELNVQLMGPRLAMKHKIPPKLLGFYRYFYNIGPNRDLISLQMVSHTCF